MKFLATDMTATTHVLYKSFHQSMYDEENNIISIPVHTASGNNPYAFTTSEFNHLLEHGHTTEFRYIPATLDHFILWLSTALCSNIIMKIYKYV